MNTLFFSKLCSGLGLLVCLAAPQVQGAEEAKERAAFYRYLNAEGVKVMSHSIPPEFAQKGYELLGPTGRVIKVVPPALTQEDIKAAEARRLLIEEYTALTRRYSGPREIEGAKQRQLERLEANVSITKGNINNLKRQMDTLTSKAANFERANKPISADVLDALKNTRTELATAEALLIQREKERQDVVDRFDHEKDLFLKGGELIRTPATPSNLAPTEPAATPQTPAPNPAL